jgi:2'-5' RNA ligase
MLKKYNIALVPVLQNEKIIRCAEYFLKISDQYQLGKNSLPHVTLCHFQANENEIDLLWKRVCKRLEKHQLELTFEYFSCTTFDNKIYWISLIPDQSSTLDKMHQTVAAIVNQPINQHYDPHMTLLNTKDINYKNMLNEMRQSYTTISDHFALALGERDAVGQLIKILYQEECVVN